MPHYPVFSRLRPLVLFGHVWTMNVDLLLSFLCLRRDRLGHGLAVRQFLSPLPGPQLLFGHGSRRSLPARPFL